jgi:acetyl-CoA carboxylase biotin carboxyl carrier protein
MVSVRLQREKPADIIRTDTQNPRTGGRFVNLNFEQLKELIKLVGKSQVTEFKFESEQLKLSLSKDQEKAPERAATATVLTPPQAAPSMTSLSATAIAGEEKGAVSPRLEAPEPEAEANLVGPGQEVIVAPMVGTFYRAPSPDADPFIEMGDLVEVGSTVCIIEAMKLMNEIESEARGRVVKILAENGQAVEYGQPLFILEQV